MTLLSPLALALSAFAVPVILMYILKLRRREQVVPSTLLWRRVTHDMQANAPWQRLRITLPLVLQVLALLALVLVLAQPAYTQSSRVQGDLILIVDQSYGMQARDVAPNRFGAALARAHTLAGELTSGNVMSVIGMGDQPRLAVADSSDKDAVSRAIDGLQPGVSTPNFLAALSLARSLSRGTSTQVVVLTSRQSGISSLPLAVPFPVRIERIGGKLRDLAITDVGLKCDAKRCLALARVSNFGIAAERSDLRLLADGQVGDVRPLTVKAGTEQTIFTEALPATIQRFEARLTVRDNVATDKAAWAVAPQPEIRHVLLVSAKGFFLQAALGADPSIKLTTIKPVDYTPGRARNADVVIFDGQVPATLPNIPALVVNPSAGPAGPLHFGAGVAAGGVVPVRPSTRSLAALTEGVDLSDVHIASVRTATLPDWMEPLLQTPAGTPLLAAGDGPKGRQAVIPFDLERSDWPLRISFPVVMQNLVHYLAPGLSVGTTSLIAGRPVHLSPSPGTTSIRITKPDGSVTTLPKPFPPFTDTASPGIYRVQQIGIRAESATFSVNFFPSRPAPAKGPAIQQLGTKALDNSHTESVFTSFAWVFWLLAMLVLSAEWWVAFRR